MTEVLDAAGKVAVIPTQIAEYSPVAAALADLAHRFSGVAYDVTTTKGNAEARAARYELVKLRTSLEAKRVEIKGPTLERAKLIDTEAKKIAAAIAELEVPIDEQIKADERRREAEKQKKIDDELRRVAEIRERISMVAAVVTRAAGQPSASIEDKIKLVVAIEINGNFAEFADEAKAVHADTLAKLREMREGAVLAEARAAKLEADQIELDRLRAEEAERKRVDREREDAERQAERERLAIARREIEQREREQRAEQVRLDAEAAERRRIADAEATAERVKADRLARESREAQERIDREARAAEEKRLQAARDEIERQRNEAAAEQRARDRAEQEERQRESARLIEEQRKAEAARTRLEAAAQPMLDALLLWRLVDQSGRPKNTDAYKQAAAKREEAIALATGESIT